MTIPRKDADVLPDEAKLLAGLRAGDDQAYELLVRSYGSRLLGVARRFLRNEEDARDAVQEAFLNAFRALDRFEGDALLSTWLHRIVVNAALMKLRTRRRKPERSIEELLPSFRDDGHMQDPAEAWRKAPEEEFGRQQLRDLVLAKIHELPEAHRNVLLLRDIEELDTEAAAELLGVSAGAVKTRLHRARQALRGLLEPHLRQGAG